ncbi:MAG: DNA polymerase III subunit delta' C-terminal domain-containing protein, partial [Chloroflexota bacterium]
KTLEEPPPHAVLILIASALEPILPTIVSRSQAITLRPVAAQLIQSVLVERFDVPPDQADLLARFSGGRIGWAISAAQNPEMLDQRSQALDLLESTVRMNRAGRFDLAGSLSRDKSALMPLLELWVTYWRDLLLHVEGSPVRLCNIDRVAGIEQLAYDVTPETALKALKSTQEMLNQLGYNINLRLALETMFLEYPGLLHQA